MPISSQTCEISGQGTERALTLKPSGTNLCRDQVPTEGSEGEACLQRFDTRLAPGAGHSAASGIIFCRRLGQMLLLSWSTSCSRASGWISIHRYQCPVCSLHCRKKHPPLPTWSAFSSESIRSEKHVWPLEHVITEASTAANLLTSGFWSTRLKECIHRRQIHHIQLPPAFCSSVKAG